MKNLTLIYCGEDSESVKALEEKLRGLDSDVSLCSTEYFVGAEIAADRVIIMPDVPFFRAMPIKEAYPKAEYNPPDEFSTKQVQNALGAFAKTIDAPLISEAARSISSSMEALFEEEEVIVEDRYALVNGRLEETIVIVSEPPPKKRGWPKGKPRKVIAA